MCKKCAYVRLGCGTAVDSLPPEKYALVLTAVAIEGSWRILVVYCQCTIKWKSCSVLQWMSSTTWQRWSLYSAFDPIVPSWWKRLPNPVSSQVVHVILYVWHMMKEMYWGFERQRSRDRSPRHNAISDVLAPLPSLQGCRRHRTQWCHCHVVPKRAIRLGEQAEDGTYYRYIGKGMTVFSNNVSEAPEYCNKNLHLPQFRGCEGTMDVFLRTNIIGYKAQMKTKAETFLLDL